MPHLPRKVKVHVAKCHACHAKSRGAHGVNWEPEPAQCHKWPRLPRKVHVQWSPSATPATQNARPCRQVSRLPCKKPRRPRRQLGTQARHQRQPSAISATPATQSDDPCHQVPRLPRKGQVHVTKCHACHAKSRGLHGVNWDPSAPPEPAQCHKCHTCHAKCTSIGHHVPRLPRKVKVDVAKCHACHAKSRGVDGVNWDPSAPPEPAQCHKCHTCQAK